MEFDHLETLKYILSPRIERLSVHAEDNYLDNLNLSELRYIMDEIQSLDSSSCSSSDSIDSPSEDKSKAEEVEFELKLLGNHTIEVPPPPAIPPISKTQRVLCRIMGFDTQGCLYIVFPNEDNEVNVNVNLNHSDTKYANKNDFILIFRKRT
jgi:hypothetical protein